MDLIKAQKYVKKTSINGLYLLERETFEDERGFFREIFHLDELEEITGVKFNIAQCNHSYSKSNVIRALHAENWNKVVYPVNGKAFVAIADIRPESATFKKVETFNFGPGDKKGLFIGKGLANSICVNGEEAVNYLYVVDSYYDGSDTRAIAWDDPDLKIDWPVENPILSKRDKNNPRLRDLYPDKFS